MGGERHLADLIKHLMPFCVRFGAARHLQTTSGLQEAVLEMIDASLVIKLAATAGVVLLATVIAERAGAFVGAMIAALPISAGPAYIFIAMDHDASFVAQSALASVGINTMVSPFLLIVAALVVRKGIVVALGVALTVWLAGALCVVRLTLPLSVALVLNVVSICACFYLSRHYLLADVQAAPRRGLLDIAIRIVSVVSVVAAVIIGGKVLGPRVAGLVAVVPVVWFSMAIVTNGRLGAETCSAVLANGIPAMLGFCLAFAAIYLTIESAGPVVALSLAATLCVGWTLLLTATRSTNPVYRWIADASRLSKT